MTLEEMQKRHETREGRERLLPAEHEKLQKLGALMGEGNKYEPMAHMTREQNWTLAVYKAFHAHLVAGGVDGGIQPVIDLMENYKYLSPSIDRMGRQEVVAALQRAPHYTEPWSEEQEEQVGFWARIFGKKKKGGSGGVP